MTQDEIIRTARESQKESFFGATGHWFKMEVKDLGRFYQAAFAAGAAHEREACAKVCKDLANSHFESGEAETAGVLDHCAAAIRQRGMDLLTQHSQAIGEYDDPIV